VTNNIVGHVSPLPIWDTVQIPSPDNPSRLVVVTRVEQSSRTPHVVTTSGRIYLRSPAGSAPVTEKSDIDALVARGTRGAADADRRANQLHQGAPGASLIRPSSGAPYVIQVAAVPSPAIGDAHIEILTVNGFDAAGAILTSFPFRLLESKELAEDGVLLARGHTGGERFTDGALFLRQEVTGSYLYVGLVGATVRAVLEGLDQMRPQVHQALIDVRIIGAQSLRVDEDGSGRSPGPAFGTQLWTWARQIPTHETARHSAAAEIMRRVWRVAGDHRGLEPESPPA